MASESYLAEASGDAPRLPVALPPEAIVRNRVGDTWDWLWKDVCIRLVPFVVASAAYARLSGRGARGLGLRTEHLRREVALGAALAVPLASVASAYRARILPQYRLPTPADQALQTFYYFALNAPVEELFWRGTVQTAAEAALRHVPGARRRPRLLAWLGATAAFGLFHRLGGWNWRAIAGVSAAGAVFGALFARRGDRPSLVVPTLVHGAMTAGFLSWGDAALHARRHRR